MECGLLESVSPLSTVRPQRSHVVHTLVHKCEYPDFLEMRDGNRTGSARVGTPCGQLSVGEDYRLDLCLIRAVSSWTWSYTFRRSVISLRIFLSAYITVV